MPRFAQTGSSREDGEQKRKSHRSEMPNPPPAATPLTTAMVGLGICNRSKHQENSGSAGPLGQARLSFALRSAPEQNASPAPVRTRTLAKGSAPTWVMSWRIPTRMAPFRALSTSGLFNVATTTPFFYVRLLFQVGIQT